MCIKNASQVCNMILSNLHNCDNDTLVKLFKTYARPYLDYNSVIYAPHHIQLIKALEQVQRHFTKRLHGLSNLCYKERLNIVGLETLELRRMHTDLLTLYKLIHKKIDCSLINTFKFNNTVNTRGHAYKLVKESFRVDCRKYSFTCRVINLWNSLSNEIVCCILLTNLFINLELMIYLILLGGNPLHSLLYSLFAPTLYIQCE